MKATDGKHAIIMSTSLRATIWRVPAFPRRAVFVIATPRHNDTENEDSVSITNFDVITRADIDSELGKT